MKNHTDGVSIFSSLADTESDGRSGSAGLQSNPSIDLVQSVTGNIIESGNIPTALPHQEAKKGGDTLKSTLERQTIGLSSESTVDNNLVEESVLPGTFTSINAESYSPNGIGATSGSQWSERMAKKRRDFDSDNAKPSSSTGSKLLNDRIALKTGLSSQIPLPLNQPDTMSSSYGVSGGEISTSKHNNFDASKGSSPSLGAQSSEVREFDKLSSITRNSHWDVENGADASRLDTGIQMNDLSMSTTVGYAKKSQSAHNNDVDESTNSARWSERMARKLKESHSDDMKPSATIGSKLDERLAQKTGGVSKSYTGIQMDNSSMSATVGYAEKSQSAHNNDVDESANGAQWSERMARKLKESHSDDMKPSVSIGSKLDERLAQKIGGVSKSYTGIQMNDSSMSATVGYAKKSQSAHNNDVDESTNGARWSERMARKMKESHSDDMKPSATIGSKLDERLAHKTGLSLPKSSTMSSCDNLATREAKAFENKLGSVLMKEVNNEIGVKTAERLSPSETSIKVGAYRTQQIDERLAHKTGNFQSTYSSTQYSRSIAEPLRYKKGNELDHRIKKKINEEVKHSILKESISCKATGDVNDDSSTLTSLSSITVQRSNTTRDNQSSTFNIRDESCADKTHLSADWIEDDILISSKPAQHNMADWPHSKEEEDINGKHNIINTQNYPVTNHEENLFKDHAEYKDNMSSTKDKTEYNEEFEEEEYLIKDSDKKINILKHSQKDNNGAQVKPGGVQRSLSRALAYISFRSNFFLYRNKNDNLTSKQPELRQSDTDADVTCYSLFCQWLQSMRGGFLILVILVGVLVTAVVFLGQNGKKEVCGEEIYSQIYDTLKNVSSVENLSNKDSPQRRALDWIMCIDEMRLLPSVDGSSKFIQRYVLMVLYFSLNPTWSFLDDGKNWAVLNIHECQWDKIICQENQKVVKKINFRNSRISTNIPSEIGHLSNLEHFDISSNKMEGTIPYIIFSLKNLNNLFIQENNFKGKIDDKMGNLSRLERLSMHNNKFSGKLPDALKSLKNLQFLYLDHNELSGNLFDLLRHTPEITEVMSKNNYFSGTIPIEVAKLSLLRYVDISNNYFNGMIPQELKQLSLLSFLNLANNDFRGHIPTGIGLLSNLVGFSVAKCKLTGTIPNSIARLGNLETLDLSRNKISGTIPDDFGKLTELTQLNLLSNKISGNLPRTFANLTKLYQLYIQQNELKGEIHSDICALNLHRFEADCKDEVSCKCCTTCYSI